MLKNERLASRRPKKRLSFQIDDVHSVNSLFDQEPLTGTSPHSSTSLYPGPVKVVARSVHTESTPDGMDPTGDLDSPDSLLDDDDNAGAPTYEFPSDRSHPIDQTPPPPPPPAHDTDEEENEKREEDSCKHENIEGAVNKSTPLSSPSSSSPVAAASTVEISEPPTQTGAQEEIECAVVPEVNLAELVTLQAVVTSDLPLVEAIAVSVSAHEQQQSNNQTRDDTMASQPKHRSRSRARVASPQRNSVVSHTQTSTVAVHREARSQGTAPTMSRAALPTNTTPAVMTEPVSPQQQTSPRGLSRVRSQQPMPAAVAPPVMYDDYDDGESVPQPMPPAPRARQHVRVVVEPDVREPEPSRHHVRIKSRKTEDRMNRARSAHSRPAAASIPHKRARRDNRSRRQQPSMARRRRHEEDDELSDASPTSSFSTSASENSEDSTTDDSDADRLGGASQRSTKQSSPVKVHRSLFRGGEFNIRDVLTNLQRLHVSTSVAGFCSVASFFFLIGANYYQPGSKGILAAMFLNLLVAVLNFVMYVLEGWQHYAAISKMYRAAERLRVRQLKSIAAGATTPAPGTLTQLQLFQQNFLLKPEFQAFYGWSRHLQMLQSVLALPVAVATIFFTVYGLVDGVTVGSFWDMGIGPQFMYMLLLISSGGAIIDGAVFSWLLNRFDYRSVMLFLNESKEKDDCNNDTAESATEALAPAPAPADVIIEMRGERDTVPIAAVAEPVPKDLASRSGSFRDDDADYDVSDDGSSVAGPR